MLIFDRPMFNILLSRYHQLEQHLLLSLSIKPDEPALLRWSPVNFKEKRLL